MGQKHTMKRKMETDYELGYEKAFEDFKKATDTDTILMGLWMDYAYRLTGFWYNKNGKQDYKVIVTKFDKGYAKGLEDIEHKFRGDLMLNDEHKEDTWQEEK